MLFTPVRIAIMKENVKSQSKRSIRHAPYNSPKKEIKDRKKSSPKKNMSSTQGEIDESVIAKVKSMHTRNDIKKLLQYARPLSAYQPGVKITVNDKMQTGYSYTLSEPVGENFAPGFEPKLTPAEMLAHGVFEGKYLNDCVLELPREWFQAALDAGKLSPEGPNVSVNEFRIKSRQPLQVWRNNGWIPLAPGDKDVRGWFQWYCRYYLGRRMKGIDVEQVKRWRAFARHAGQIRASYQRMETPPTTDEEKRAHRPRQRQALLQWAHDPYL
eukprot:Rmarinus@m.3223